MKLSELLNELNQIKIKYPDTDPDIEIQSDGRYEVVEDDDGINLDDVFLEESDILEGYVILDDIDLGLLMESELQNGVFDDEDQETPDYD